MPTISPAIELVARVLIPNASTLFDNPVLPRKSDLWQYFPQEAQPPQPPWGPHDFYEHAHATSQSETAQIGSLDELRCDLYPFQRRGVAWMLEREGARSCQQEQACLEYGFVKWLDSDGRPRFFSQLLGLATADGQMVKTPMSHGPNGISGGILADEMGLGKTVELIALICLNKKPEKRDAAEIETTLIITPPALLNQWRSEIKTLAPALSVAVYEGMKSESQKDDEQIMKKFSSNQIVITTYPTVARDIYHAEGPTKSLRHEKRYHKRISPLVLLKFWRVILDEAQMLDSGVSNAAKVATLIDAHNRWCCSGTPGRTAQDFFSLFKFLRVQPYCSLPAVWPRLANEYRPILHTLFKQIALRHTKAKIGAEIVIPAQKRCQITLPFNPVEAANYHDLFQQMTDECGLQADGEPRDGVSIHDSDILERLSGWLTRLRQVCLHPGVGTRNRRALGKGREPLRTLGDVLDVMIEQTETAVRTDKRLWLHNKIQRGQILEHAERTQEALDLWLQTLEETHADVEECRAQQQLDHDATAADEDLGATKWALRLRSALETEHICTFFIGNGYYQLKAKELAECAPPNAQDSDALSSMTENVTSGRPISPTMSAKAKQLEAQEESYYEKAKQLRQELLAESREKTNSRLAKLKSLENSSLPSTPATREKAGLQTVQTFARLNEIYEVLERQKIKLAAWREKALKYLLAPLIDSEEEQLTGEEYEASTRHQDEIFVLVDALRALVSDRQTLINGIVNPLVNHEMAVLGRDANDGAGHAPSLMIQLLAERDELRSLRPENHSLRSIATELKELKANLRGLVEHGNSRAAGESLIVSRALQDLGQVTSQQTQSLEKLVKEMDLLKHASNMRLDFYRQLQMISDNVAPLDISKSEEDREQKLLALQVSETKLREHVATLTSKGRYLNFLKGETEGTQDTQRSCIICTSHFDRGVLTSCGHAFCADCLKLWLNQHRSCPSCKAKLSRNDLFEITLKPQEIVVEEESSGQVESASSSDSGSSIYTAIQGSLLNDIQRIEVSGSFGSKIDALARHVLWLREHDPGAKMVIFSSYRDFLSVLSQAFTQFKIPHTKVDGKDGIEKFKEDPHIECFLLHAKAQSSGLNLVCATHVFLCEPLIATPIELQAIARVHRIGQHQETTVWSYLIDHTVETAIYDISVKRRLALMGETGNGQAADRGLESRLEAANTHELEQASLAQLLNSKGGGEIVPKDLVHSCLFSSRAKRPDNGLAAEGLVARHLRAEAVETRNANDRRDG